MGCFSISDRELRWVGAGQDPALMVDPDTDEFDELKGHGLAFGLDYTFEYWVLGIR